MGIFDRCGVIGTVDGARNHGASPPRERSRVVILETKPLWCDCFRYLITNYVPGVGIEFATDASDILPGFAELVLLGVDPASVSNPDDLGETLITIQKITNGAPIAIMLHADDVAFARMISTLTVSAIFLPSGSMEIAIAALGLVLAGGAFMPPEVVRLRNHIEARAPVERRPFSPEAPAPQDYIATGLQSPQDITPRELALTIRERDVLKSLRAGRPNKIIAFELGISESTVKVHLRNIMKKLHASNRTQVALHSDISTPEFADFSGG